MRHIAVLFLFLSLFVVVHAQDNQSGRYESMDYGPFLSLTLCGCSDATGHEANAVKATIFRFGDRFSPACMAYDTELMRTVSGWQNGFIDFNGVGFNGAHNVQPRARGTAIFSTKQTPGWSLDGKFEDPRPSKQGNLPKSWLRYRGIYRCGNDSVLSYSVGDANVLESPHALKYPDSGGVEFVRIFNVGATRKALTLLVCDKDYSVPQIAQTGYAALGADSYTLKFPGEYLNLAIQTQGAPIGSSWDFTGGRVSLKLPPLCHEARFTVRISAAPNGRTYFTPHFAPCDLHQFTHGGPGIWPGTVTTRGEKGNTSGPYVVDTLTAPDNNPWNAWMRFGGIDFFPDGKRAALCTWSGDVWIVSGLDENLEKLEWKRFATGLQEPLGLKIVDGKIFVTCRNQIARLHDFDGDGECDFYENFNSDCIVTPNYHEFALDLDADKEGNLYFAKSSAPSNGPTNYDYQSPHNGCFFKLSKDGEKLEILARGLRVPNGLAVGPNGELTCSDNDGSWVPSCPINEIKPGYFLGVTPSAWPDRAVPEKRDPPICWIPAYADNSAGGQVWVKGGKWGPFEGKMLHMSYGKASLFAVMTETVNGQIQGGVAKFPLQFGSGIMRARFNPADGQLYVCGLKGWQTTGVRDGIFQRVRYTGKPANMPYELHVKSNGIEVKFTDELNRADAEDNSNYSAYWFNVKWSIDYSSPRYSVLNPRKRWEKQTVDPVGDYLYFRSVKLAADNKTLFFDIPGLQPVTNVVLRMRITGADGSRINQEIDSTINRMP